MTNGTTRVEARRDFPIDFRMTLAEDDLDKNDQRHKDREELADKRHEEIMGKLRWIFTVFVGLIVEVAAALAIVLLTR